MGVRILTPRALARLAAALLVLALPGCGLFKPTEPEPPSGGVVKTDYSTPENTLATLALAVQDKGTTTGQTAYLGGLADLATDGVGFNAIPLASVVQSLPEGTDISWNRDRESDFYGRLMQIDASAPYSMQWAPDTRFSDSAPGSDPMILNRGYTISTPQRIIAKGYAKLTFQEVSPGRWVIVTWEEQEVEPGDDLALTFSMLRLNG